MKQFKIRPSITSRDSILEAYLKDISKYPTITPEEEVELANKIQQGDDKALDKLVTSNLRFVVTVAKQYQNSGLSLSDLINEGNLGLITAARKFDPTKGFKFISYAVWWIRQSIFQALTNTGRMVRLPANKVEDISKVNQLINTFIQENEREPTVDEITDLISISPDKIKTALNSGFKHVSLDSTISPQEETTLLDVVENTECPKTDYISNKESTDFEVLEILNTLSDREKFIITNFFGINTDELTLEEIGTRLNITRERVRQIKDTALNKLKTKKNLNILSQYIK